MSMGEALGPRRENNHACERKKFIRFLSTPTWPRSFDRVMSMDEALGPRRENNHAREIKKRNRFLKSKSFFEIEIVF